MRGPTRAVNPVLAVARVLALKRGLAPTGVFVSVKNGGARRLEFVTPVGTLALGGVQSNPAFSLNQNKEFRYVHGLTHRGFVTYPGARAAGPVALDDGCAAHHLSVK